MPLLRTKVFLLSLVIAIVGAQKSPATNDACTRSAATDGTCVDSGSTNIDDEVNFLMLTTEVTVRGKRHSTMTDRPAAAGKDKRHKHSAGAKAMKQEPAEQAETRSDLAQTVLTSGDSGDVHVKASTGAQEREIHKHRQPMKAEYFDDDRQVVANIELSVPLGPFCVLIAVIVLLGVGVVLFLHQHGLGLRSTDGFHACAADEHLGAKLDDNFWLKLVSRHKRQNGLDADIIKDVPFYKKEVDDASDDGSDCPRMEVLSEDEPECEVDVDVEESPALDESLRSHDCEGEHNV